jgi:Uma2 family endonuclease
MQKTEEAPALSPDEGDRYEVVNGERRELGPRGAFECCLATALSSYLVTFVLQRRLGVIAMETLFVLDLLKDLERRPDVAFVSTARWPSRKVPRETAWNVVPDLAVEIISPTDSADEVDRKLTEYFQAGVRLVWVMYPDSGRVYAYRSPTEVRGVDRSGEIDGEDVVPGFKLPVEKLYEAVTPAD